jgi:hypothetical protein
MVHAAKGVSKAQIQRMLNAAGQPSSTFKMYDTVRSEGEALVVSETLHKEDGTLPRSCSNPQPCSNDLLVPLLVPTSFRPCIFRAYIRF